LYIYLLVVIPFNNIITFELFTCQKICILLHLILYYKKTCICTFCR
jgi:hypothetical protein